MAPFDSERHLALSGAAWSAETARATATEIVADVWARLAPDGFWPPHPEEDGGGGRFNFCLYDGAAGTLWGLLELSSRLGLRLPVDPVAMASRIHAGYLAAPDSESVVPSYFIGETGVLSLLHRLKPEESVRRALMASVESNARNPVNEALWGSPGTMLVARRLGEREAFLRAVDYLFETWTEAEGIWIWRQDLYGQMRRFIGAGHGFFGNVYPLLEGQSWLDEERRGLLLSRVEATSWASARRADGMANWMPSFFSTDARAPLTQWCHGAPGFITSMRSFPSDYSERMEILLSEAGETVWRAGPLRKGIGLCHGTDGNGFALLRLFARTGDETWLARARAFAMHAIGQRNGRSTLWTGEIGLALFLLACVDGRADLPTMDYF